MAKLYSARPRRAAPCGRGRDRRRSSPGLRTRTFVFNTIPVDKSIDDRLRGYETWISARNLPNDTTDEAVQALVDAVVGRYDVVQRYYTLKARLLGLDRLTLLRPHGAARRGPDARSPGTRRGSSCVDAYARLLRRVGRHRRAVLPRRLDRRAAAETSAPAPSARRPSRACIPYVLHELHGRPALGPHARARARARPARLPRAAARPLQRVRRR